MNAESLANPLLKTSVQKDWIDYNGHMNDAYYALVFSHTIDRAMAAIGLDQAGRTRSSKTIYTLTMTIHYRSECHEGDTLTTTTRILEHDKKRIRLWAEIFRDDGALAAESEQVLLCVDQSGEKPRAAAFDPEQMEKIIAIHRADAHLPFPKAAGRGISLSSIK